MPRTLSINSFFDISIETKPTLLVLDILIALDENLKIVDTQVENPLLNLFFEDAKDSVKNIFDIDITKLAQYQNRFLNYSI